MALLVPNVGESVMLQNIVNKTAPQDLVMKLYKTNVTPAEGDTAGSYTVADFTGYSNVTLTGASWTITGTAPTSAGYAQQSFTSTADQSAQLIYGYFVIQTSSGILMWAELFSNGPYSIANNGDIIKVTPTITLD